MKINLNQKQRIIVAIIYLAILSLIFYLLGGNLKQLAWDSSYDSSIWFYAGAFMIILGTYIVEPYFTKPSDAIANSTAILIALFGLSAKQDLLGYSFIFYYAVSILILSILTIFLKDSKNIFWLKFSKVTYWIVETFGTSKVIFSIIYLSASYSYFAQQNKIIPFISIVAFWICLTFFDVISLIVENFSRFINLIKNKPGEELGQAIGCENPLLYKVEIDYLKHKPCAIKYGDLVALETSINVGSIGMVVDIQYLLNKRWLSIYLLQDENGDILEINLKDKKLITEPKSIFTKENLVYLLDISTITDESLKTKIGSNPLYKNKEQFIGYVSSGSNINTLNFSIIRETNKLEQKISEGVILKTLIYGQETLYQVINGNAKEEQLENFDRHGFIIGIARKLGKYKKDTKDLDVSKWMPSNFSPLFYAFSGSVSETRVKEIAQNSIGRLPDTDLEIPLKDPNAIVTHNTAILGILGIGKSCLTFEIIKKIIANTESKVICLDITNEYFDELVAYGCEPQILPDVEIQLVLNPNYEAINKDIYKGGNHAQFRQKITELIKTFFDGANKLLIINPEVYDVSKQTNDVKAKKIGPGPNDWQDQAPMVDLTLVEKTRIIAEVILEYSKGRGKSQSARCLLVFEEAHSLVPEWNSVASEGDKSATNGTAKVILQGRKYGLGSMVVTQRTANVSKSILNQCNTIFALRVFDDTGKGFLENYIGKDYADTLATLEERHAIAIGKGLKLKQPVIIQLNNREDIIEN
ncbi:MAG: DUF87 domain-containing protein [Patescibacteria group bacterium]